MTFEAFFQDAEAFASEAFASRRKVSLSARAKDVWWLNEQ